MSVFAYCHNDKCEETIPEPSPTDAVIGHVKCPACGELYALDEFNRRFVLDEFFASKAA